MEADGWRRVEELYFAALERPEAERAAFLRDACAGDAGLLHEVESLLAQNASGEGFLDRGPLVPPTMVASPARSVRGRRLGAYDIGDVLGAGGMGEVYRARDAKLRRDVAIKILPPAFTLDPDRRARFEREARILASLNHPHIGAIYGFEESDGVHALVLELVDGSTLAERIAKGPVPVREALTIARQIADALDAAHEKGIVHRDLKPSNIKITPEGVVKVLDFGLAKATAPAATSNPPSIEGTREGMILGTAAYMSPEQARGQPVDKRTDIWAFGCVLYEMLTGRAPFARGTLTDTLAAILDREPDWNALPDSTPGSIGRLLHRCLEKDRKRRRREISEARIELEEALTTSAAGHRAAESASVAVRQLSPVRQRVAWAIAGLAVALSALWIFYVRQPAPEPAAVTLSLFPPKGTTFPFESGAPWPSVSPDGRQVVFAALLPDGTQQLWIRPLDSTAARPLQGTDGAMRPFWSPDSDAIAFFSNGKMWRLDLPGDSPQAICDAPYQGGLVGTWGRDGVIVYNHNQGLYRVSARGGEPALILPRSNEAGGPTPVNPTFLPDGRRFLYVNESDANICIGSLDSGRERCIFSVSSPVRFASPGYLLFVRDDLLRAQRFDPSRLELSGEAVAVSDIPINVRPLFSYPPFSVSENQVLAFHPNGGETRLVWLNRSGQQVGTVGTLGNYGRPSISPDEKQLVISRGPSGGLWLYDLASGTGSRFTDDPTVNISGPTLSPDGEHVAFSATRNGVPRLYQKQTNGVGPEEVLVDSGGSFFHWSADGRFLIYQLFDPKTGWDLWAAPLFGDRRPFAVAQTEHGERVPQFSPDVRWIAYDSTETGRREIWIQPFPSTGRKWQVSLGGGFSPTWRRDGKELYYVAADGKMMAITINADSGIKLGAPQVLFQTMFREGAYGNYGVSADGQRFLINVPPAAEDLTPITVVVNWAAALNTRN
jgi:Tol biopolymer transport system component